MRVTELLNQVERAEDAQQGLEHSVDLWKSQTSEAKARYSRLESSIESKDQQIVKLQNIIESLKIELQDARSAATAATAAADARDAVEGEE